MLCHVQEDLMPLHVKFFFPLGLNFQTLGEVSSLPEQFSHGCCEESLSRENAGDRILSNLSRSSRGLHVATWDSLLGILFKPSERCPCLPGAVPVMERAHSQLVKMVPFPLQIFTIHGNWGILMQTNQAIRHPFSPPLPHPLQCHIVCCLPFKSVLESQRSQIRV